MIVPTLETVVCPGCGVVCRNWSEHANHGKYSEACTPQMRFWARVNKNTPTGCWIWTGCVDKWGYGDISYMSKHVQAHRLSWRLLRGEPGVLDVLHKCNTPPCCNPEHLYLGTDKENARDRVAAETHVRGADNWSAKLSEVNVREIRAAYWFKGKLSNAKELAAKYGVSPAAITHITSGRTWSHVK